MADITYPAYFPFSTGDIPTADQVMDLMYDDTTAGLAASWHGLNGMIQAENFNQNTLVVSKEHVQRGAMVYADERSGTANLDYKFYWFREYVLGDGDWASKTLDENTPYQPIPGGCVPHYQKWDGLCLVEWSIYWAAHTITPDKEAGIFLMVDGEYQDAQYRSANSIGFELWGPLQYEKGRVWSGHALISLDKGWHDIGLCLIADGGINTTRIHAVSIVPLAIRTRDS